MAGKIEVGQGFEFRWGRKFGLNGKWKGWFKVG
jgi:hypothetical protein